MCGAGLGHLMSCNSGLKAKQAEERKKTMMERRSLCQLAICWLREKHP